MIKVTGNFEVFRTYRAYDVNAVDQNIVRVSRGGQKGWRQALHEVAGRSQNGVQCKLTRAQRCECEVHA